MRLNKGGVMRPAKLQNTHIRPAPQPGHPSMDAALQLSGVGGGAAAPTQTQRRWWARGLLRASRGVARAALRMRRATRRRQQQQHRRHPDADEPQEQQHAAAAAAWGLLPFWAPLSSQQLAADAASTPAPWQQLVPDWLSSPLQQLMQQPPPPPGADDGEQPRAAAAQGSSRGRRGRRRNSRGVSQLEQEQDQHLSTSGFSAAALAEMVNPANCFPMLLQPPPLLPPAAHHQQQPAVTAPDGSCQPECAAETALVAAGSSSTQSWRRPQQLLTVGCRHWSSLLRIRVYDYALYVDGQQAQAALLPSSPLLLAQPGASASQQHAGAADTAAAAAADLPGLLKSSGSDVDMSLVLKAAREIPLEMLAAEYDKVLSRRLARIGGSAADRAALQTLLASFTQPERLPAAVKGGSGRSSDSSGGSKAVRKGAMIVFERSNGGSSVTARVGPVVLSTVVSPKVADALFDLYLGKEPVCRTARDAAGATLARIAATAAAAAAAADARVTAGGSSSAGSGEAAGAVQQTQQRQPKQPRPRFRQRRQPKQQQHEGTPADGSTTGSLPTHYLPSSKGQTIQCDSGKGLRVPRGIGGRRRRQQQQQAGSNAGLGLQELAACVLHMG